MQFLKELQNHTAKLSTFQNDNFIRTFMNRKVIQHQSKKGSKMITQFQVLAEKKKPIFRNQCGTTYLGMS